MTIAATEAWHQLANKLWGHPMPDAPQSNPDGFPYFWLGAEAESIPTPWRTVWLIEPLTAPVVITRFFEGSCKPA